jgi:hypothetical protein
MGLASKVIHGKHYDRKNDNDRFVLQFYVKSSKPLPPSPPPTIRKKVGLMHHGKKSQIRLTLMVVIKRALALNSKGQYHPHLRGNNYFPYGSTWVRPDFWRGLWWSSFEFSVLCFVCICPVSCVPNVARVSGLSNLDFPLQFSLMFN